MLPYNRLNDLFNYLKTNTLMPGEKLALLLQVSERTIRSDILSLNEILKVHGSQILLKRKEGYYLKIDDIYLHQEFLNNLGQSSPLELDSSEDRMKFILHKLLYATSYVTLDYLSGLVCISKNTLNTYIKTLRVMLEKYHLEYVTKVNVGVKIIGDEKAKRLCLLENILSPNFQNYITGFTKDEITLFYGIDLYKIQHIVTQHLEAANISSSDFEQKNLIIHFALMVSRIKNHCDIQEVYQKHKGNEEIIRCINHIVLDLEYFFNIEVNQAEKQYLYSHFISNTNVQAHFDQSIDIDTLVKELLENIHRNYNFDLSNDTILNHDLVLHFQSILNSKSFSLNKRNPLLNTIKNNFPLPYEITLTAIAQTFQNSNYTLTEDEIGYVSLHIGAAIERCFSGVIQRKNVILLCGSGQATTRMLETRINVFFKDKLTIIKKVSYREFLNLQNNSIQNIDFVISTIPIESQQIPVICVDFALHTKDIEAISRFLVNSHYDTTKKIDKFFDSDLFIKGNVNDKDILLKKLFQKLKDKHYVDDYFYESVIHRESIATTNMNEVFALPHPMELCAKETKVAVAILESPITWNEDATVRIVFLLAIKQDEHLDIEHLYDVFIDIMNNPRLQNEIIQSGSFEDFLKTLYQKR